MFAVSWQEISGIMEDAVRGWRGPVVMQIFREAPGGTKGAKGTEKEPPYLPSSYRLLLAGTGRRGSGVELSSAAWDVCTYIYYQPLGPDYIHTSLNEACHSRWRQRRIGDHQECDNLSHSNTQVEQADASNQNAFSYLQLFLQTCVAANYRVRSQN